MPPTTTTPYRRPLIYDAEMRLRAPSALMNALRASAERNGRSVTGEARYAIRQHLAREEAALSNPEAPANR